MQELTKLILIHTIISNKDKIKQKLDENPHFSSKRIAKELNMSRSTVYEIMTKELGKDSSVHKIIQFTKSLSKFCHSLINAPR